MSLKEKAFSGFIWSALQNFGTAGITFIVQIILARIISPSEFGLLGMILIFNAIGVALSDSGVSQSIIRMKDASKEDYFILFVFNIGISFLIYILLFLFAPLIANFYENERLTALIRVFALIIPIKSSQIVQITKLVKELNFKLQATIQIPSILISCSIGLILGYKGYGVWALVWMQLIQAGLISIQYWWKLNYIPQGNFDIVKAKEHFTFGYKLLISNLLDSVYLNLFPAVIGKFNTPASVGYFSRSISLMLTPIGLVAAAFNKVTYPLFAEIQSNLDRLVKAFRRLLRLILFITTPIMCLFFIIAKPLIIILITDTWLPMIPYFKWLCMSGIIFPLHIYYLNIIKVKGRSDLFLKAEILKKIIGLIILVITAPMGVMAIVYGILVTSILSLFINQFYCNIVIPYSFKLQNIDATRVIFPSLLVMIVSLFLTNYVTEDLNNFLSIFVSTIIFGILYIFIQYFFNRETFLEFKYLLDKGKSKFANKI